MRTHKFTAHIEDDGILSTLCCASSFIVLTGSLSRVQYSVTRLLGAPPKSSQTDSEEGDPSW